MFTSILTNIKKLIRELSDNPSAQAAVLFAASVIIIYIQREYLLETFIPNISEIILTYVGYGFVTFSIFFIGVIAAVIHFKKDFLIFWPQLIASILTVISIQLLMGAFKGPQGIVFKETTGGKLGKYLWQDFYIPGPILLLLLVAIAFYIFWPKFSLDKLKIFKIYFLSFIYSLAKIFKSEPKKPRIIEKKSYQEPKDNPKPKIEESKGNLKVADIPFKKGRKHPSLEWATNKKVNLLPIKVGFSTYNDPSEKVGMKDSIDKAVAKAKKRKMSWSREIELKEARILIRQMKKNGTIKSKDRYSDDILTRLSNSKHGIKLTKKQ